MAKQPHIMYPNHAQVRAATQQGRQVTIRHVEQADADLLAKFYHQLSPESRRMRFMATTPDGPDELIYAQAQQMAQIDPLLEAALIVTTGAADASQAVGVARLSRADPVSTTAEVAIVLLDAYQKQGLGTLLFDLLLQLAMVRGLEQVWATCFAENAGMQRLVKNSGLPYTSQTSRGETIMLIELMARAPLDRVLSPGFQTTAALA